MQARVEYLALLEFTIISTCFKAISHSAVHVRMSFECTCTGELFRTHFTLKWFHSSRVTRFFLMSTIMLNEITLIKNSLKTYLTTNMFLSRGSATNFAFLMQKFMLSERTLRTQPFKADTTLMTFITRMNN